MERVLDFSDVTSYDFNLIGPDMILKLFQGDVVTKIRIETDKALSTVVNSVADNVTTEEQVESAPVATIVKTETTSSPRRKRVPQLRLQVAQVREIRNNWDATVKACGSKTAAAERLASVYKCSVKNIYAIIYRYSWAHV